MKSPLNIAVIMGGPSAERQVSLRGGRAVAAALRGIGHRVEEVDPKHRNFDLPEDTELAFLVLHGEFGEDGTIQRELEDRGVPYTGSGIEGSRLAFDKLLTKEALVERRIPTARHATVSRLDADWPANLRAPLVLKPVRQGSSVGLRFVGGPTEWRQSLQESLSFGAEVLVEERILGREVTVAVIDGKALPVVEVRPLSGAYDYQSKYTDGHTEYICPALFNAGITRRLESVAMEAFEAVSARDYARVDMIVQDDGTPVVLEVNTLPGMTETSLFPKAAAAAGIAFPALCQLIVDLTMRRGLPRSRPDRRG